MKFVIEMRMDNAAFEVADPEARDGDEVARILRDIATKVEGQPINSDTHSGVIFDYNGNRVGSWEVVD